MLLTLTSTAPRADDLGYLLHKHPDRVQAFEVGVGTAHVFYPESGPQRCTVAMLLEIDPIALVRNKRFGADGAALAQYVNDRPYAASSMLSVAIGRVFGSALKGRCPARPELENAVLPLQVELPAVPVQGAGDLLERLFAPLGWQVEAAAEPLDRAFPEWGDSRYHRLRLTGELRLAEALSHIYVLLPVLDGAKHYWVSSDEVDKLIRSGGAWLADHPERELITRRYLAHRGRFVQDALSRLAALDDLAEDVTAESPATPDGEPDGTETGGGRSDFVPLRDLRRQAVLSALREVGAARVVDLGCGDGALLRPLLEDRSFTEVVGVDVSVTELERAARRLRLDQLPDAVRARLTLRQSSVTYADPELAGYDAMVLMEVIEHVDADRLPDLERAVFERAAARTVVVTTPNREYNVRYPHLEANRFRHPDHRFEWTRAEFAGWAQRVATASGYRVELRGVGDADPGLGSPTQLALFVREGEPV